MAAGLFELRKDAITGWWVATVVDRAFHRDRFALAAEPVADDHCQNCGDPPGDGVRLRVLKDFAFHVVGTESEARELEDETSVAFAPYASRSPFEVWIVPRRHDSDFSRATDSDVAAIAESLRTVLTRLSTLDGPPYNLVLHTAPLREQVDSTFHWHW